MPALIVNRLHRSAAPDERKYRDWFVVFKNIPWYPQVWNCTELVLLFGDWYVRQWFWAIIMGVATPKYVVYIHSWFCSWIDGKMMRCIKNHRFQWIWLFLRVCDAGLNTTSRHHFVMTRQTSRHPRSWWWNTLRSTMLFSLRLKQMRRRQQKTSETIARPFAIVGSSSISCVYV